MSSSSHARRGFTLFEVLAAVLILGLIYTVLADRAVRGLRSEGIDRRRTEAAALADARLVDLETLLASGAPLEPLQDETLEGDYRVYVEILPEDVEALLPPPPEELAREPGEDAAPRLLVDDQGESRLYRILVAVSWDESGQPQEVRRITWDFDKSELALLFPDTGEGGSGEAGGADGEQTGEEGEEADSGSGNTPRSGSSSDRGCDCSNATTIEEMMECLRCQ